MKRRIIKIKTVEDIENIEGWDNGGDGLKEYTFYLMVKKDGKLDYTIRNHENGKRKKEKVTLVYDG